MPHVLVVGRNPAALEALRPTGATVEEAEDLSRAREADLVVAEDAAAVRAALAPDGPPVAGPGDDLALAVALARARSAERALATQARVGARAVEAAERELVERLAAAAAYSDDNTEEHMERVGALAARLGAALGLEADEVARLRAAATLHDIGKIAVPDTILLKPGRLTPEELTVVRTHAAIGARILAGSSVPVVQLAATIARSHHERWDGTGYPDGLAGEAIPLAGRIVAVADVFDVLTHERPYREERTPEQALEELRRGAGTQFDPSVVAAF
jgi:putative two-component system response regulator